MEEMQGSTVVLLEEHMVEAHMIQHPHLMLNSYLVVGEEVAVGHKFIWVEEEVMEEQPFVCLPSIRLRLMVQS